MRNGAVASPGAEVRRMVLPNSSERSTPCGSLQTSNAHGAQNICQVSGTLRLHYRFVAG
jgi:hypothetical protein